MKKIVIALHVIALFLACLCPDLRAEEPEPGELSAEQLLFLEVPVVVTASRKEQPVTEAPAAVTVITAEDIRQAGALTIPDLLRTVSGVEVMTITARDQQVGMRGINSILNNKLLVMIDGRSVYLDINGNVFWSLFPVGLEEIERIEVIKSPISSLYGANAFSGVINIITKTPRKLDGTQVDLTAGSRDTNIGSVMQAGRREKLYYKLSAGFDRTDEWGSSERAGDVARGDFLLGYDIDERSLVSLSGGRTRAEEMQLFSGEAIGTATITGNFDYLQLDYGYSQIKFRTYLKSEDYEVRLLRSGDESDWYTLTYDAELLGSFAAGRRHSLVLGADYRNNFIRENPFIPDDHGQDLWALFFEDEIRLTDHLRLIVGGRFDHHPQVKENISPRGTLLYLPSESQTYRLSVSQAYRNPTLIDSFIHVEQQILEPFPLTLGQTGNENLDPEGITAYELGYRSAPTDKAVLGLNLFYNEYADLFIFPAGTTFYDADELFPGSPGGVIPRQIVTRAMNGGDAWGVGGELDLEVLVNSWLSLFTNYSYQQTTDKDDNPSTLLINEKDRRRQDVPEHKVNAGIRTKFKNGLSASLLAHWADGTERRIIDLSGNEFLARTDPYTIVNARIGYALRKGKAEASLSVFNLFNDRHFEYPPGINLPDRSSDPVGRKVAFKVSCRF
jgi:iron complex outermembrane receptor protein